jgi:hypothetical protein
VHDRLKDKLKFLIVTLCSFTGLALLAEYAVFLGLQHPSYIPSFAITPFRDYYTHHDRNIVQVTDCARYDSGLFYLLAPGRCLFTNREFRVSIEANSLGLRDDEASLESPKIICLGDSYTMGWGVGQGESFPHLLERLSGHKTLNAAMSSFGTAREIILLDRLDLDSVTHILIQYHANDFGENASFRANNNSLQIRPERSYDSLRQYIESRNKYFPFKHLYGVSKGVAKQFFARSRSPRVGASAAQDFLDIVKAANVRPDITIIIFKLDDHNRFPDDLATSADSLLRTPAYQMLNVKTLEIADVLTDSDYFVLDEHINAKGHRKIASKIHDRFFND